MVIGKLNNLKRRGGLKYLIAIFIPAAILFLSGFVQPKQVATREYQIKAVFLFNFFQFITWPEETFENADAPMIIGILGKDPFGPYLEEAVQNEKIDGHPLALKRFPRLTDVDTCHILFISADLSERIPVIAKTLKGKNILTVSDAHNFAKNGGMIRLFTENNKIKLRINLEMLRAEKFVVSSKLLRLAEIIDTNKK